MLRVGKLGGWFKAYLIFGLVSFLLGFIGYLATEPPTVSERVAARWSDFTAIFPVLADLNWFNKAAPAFNRLDMPTVLLVMPEAGGEAPLTDFYLEFEAKLQQFSPHLLRISYGATGNEIPNLGSVTPLYRKYLLVGLRTLPAEAETKRARAANCQLTVGAPAYLASELFPKLAEAIPDKLAAFEWEQKEITNGRLLTIEWYDRPEQSRIREIAGVCLTVFEAERAVMGKGYEL